MSVDELIDGRWYWVAKAPEGPWFPAKHVKGPGAWGGWTNEDTWEDFDAEIKVWSLIELPFFKGE